MSDDAAERLARALDARGLTEPARLLAESHRPMAPLLSDLGAAVGPLLRAIGGSRTGGLARFMGDEAALQRLTDGLDELERSRAEPR
jgi:hypothetical protein